MRGWGVGGLYGGWGVRLGVRGYKNCVSAKTEHCTKRVARIALIFRTKIHHFDKLVVIILIFYDILFVLLKKGTKKRAGGKE